MSVSRDGASHDQPRCGGEDPPSRAGGPDVSVRRRELLAVCLVQEAHVTWSWESALRFFLLWSNPRQTLGPVHVMQCRFQVINEYLNPRCDPVEPFESVQWRKPDYMKLKVRKFFQLKTFVDIPLAVLFSKQREAPCSVFAEVVCRRSPASNQNKVFSPLQKYLMDEVRLKAADAQQRAHEVLASWSITHAHAQSKQRSLLRILRVRKERILHAVPTLEVLWEGAH